jgi:uncharacterized protein YecE (DUF72 family)
MTMRANRQVYVGTSGWYYPDWRGNFYPEGLAKARWFAHYATRFSAVELNSTFYHLPKIDLFRAWAERAPAAFLYAVKAPRDLTHRHDTDRDAILQTLAEGARELGSHLGPILYQFPPWTVRDVACLRRLVTRLPAGFDHVIEFRHPSWYTEEVQEILTGGGVAFCIQDMHGSASPWWVTSPVAYVRMHGPTKRKYTGRYGAKRLHRLADELLHLSTSARKVFVFFNNTTAGAGAADAQELQELLRLQKALLVGGPAA